MASVTNLHQSHSPKPRLKHTDSELRNGLQGGCQADEAGMHDILPAKGLGFRVFELFIETDSTVHTKPKAPKPRVGSRFTTCLMFRLCGLLLWTRSLQIHAAPQSCVFSLLGGVCLVSEETETFKFKPCSQPQT